MTLINSDDRKRYARAVAVLAYWRVMKAGESNVRFRRMVINGHAKIGFENGNILYRITPAGERYAEGVSICR